MSSNKKKKNKKKTDHYYETKLEETTNLTQAEIDLVIKRTNALILELKKDQKNPFSKHKNDLIEQQINELNKHIEKKHYNFLLSKLDQIDAFKKNQLDEEKQAKLERKQAFKNKWSVANIKQQIKQFDKYPIYSRLKRIKANYEGSEKNVRIGLMFASFFILLLIAIIAVLVYLNYIPYVITTDVNKIFPVVLFAIAIIGLFLI